MLLHQALSCYGLGLQKKSEKSRSIGAVGFCMGLFAPVIVGGVGVVAAECAELELDDGLFVAQF